MLSRIIPSPSVRNIARRLSIGLARVKSNASLFAKSRLHRGFRMRAVIVTAVLFSVGYSSAIHAVPNWYSGKITRLWAYGPGFILTLDSGSINDCKHKYAYFRSPELPEKYVDRMMSTALAAYASGKTVGIVIDKNVNGPDGYCFAMSIDIKG